MFDFTFIRQQKQKDDNRGKKMTVTTNKERNMQHF